MFSQWFRRGLGTLALGGSLVLAPAVADDLSVTVRKAYDSIDGEEALEHIKFLASDELEGRDTGSPGEWEAAQYIARHFEKNGLAPAGDDGTYYQNYSIGSSKGLGSDNSLTIALGEGEITFEIGKEVEPFGFSKTARVEGGLVFAGYGITSQDPAYDDYADLDVEGKVVVILRHEPQQGDEDSPFDGKAWSRHAWFNTKVGNAEDHKAAALIIVNDPLFEGDELLGMQISEGDAKIPVLHMTAAAGARLFQEAGQDPLLEVQKAIDAALEPVQIDFGATAHVATEIERQRIGTRNVIGLLRGSDPALADEYVVVGAHFDHVGWGQFGSRGGRRAIHNGADDNASGTSGVLEIVEAFGQSGLRPRRSIVFMTFSGEERGLLGSKHYCDHPIFGLDKTVAMINLDMIGRGKDGVWDANGVGTSPKFEAMIQTIETAMEKSEGIDLKVRLGQSGVAPSDNTSFYNKGIPVLFLFTGTHPDYHMPTDDWEKINLVNLELATKMTFFGIVNLAILEDERPEFTKTGRDMSQFGGPRRDGAYLGIQPDYGGDGGVRVERVLDGGPASKSGLEDGDLIQSIDGQDLEDLRGLAAVLAEKKPGDKVKMVVLRDGEKVELEVTLGKRN